MTRALLLLMLLFQGRPLYYWGARTPLIDPVGERDAPAQVARVLAIHAALDAGDLVLRFTLDRRVEQATHLPDGTPVSGRLQARLYVDGDADPTTGLAGPAGEDPRVGADRLIELGTLYLGEDEEEKRPAAALVRIAVHAVDAEGRLSPLWSADHVADPERVSLRGEWVEARLPRFQVAVEPGSRFVYAAGSRTWEGTLRP